MAKDSLKKLAELPARELEQGIEATIRAERAIVSKRPFRLAEEYWNTLGPGLTTGASDDDPSGIATYSQAGSQYGFQLLWLAAFTFPLMAVVQEMCARIGLTTGRGLAANIRRHYPRWVLYTSTTLLLAANIFNIGADLGAMAQGMQLLNPNLSFAALVVSFALLSLGLQIFTTYARYSRYLKYLALALFAYVFSALSVNLDWGAVLRSSVIPSLTFSKDQLFLACAILGTTISPYLFFWQTAQEVEEQILRGETTVRERVQSASTRELHHMQVDVWSGMFFSNLVMFFIIAASAGALYANGISNITTAAQAAQALRPFAGETAYLLFAIGIIGTGMLAIPVLAGSASYAISESFNWKFGLYRKLKEAYAFYGVIIMAMVVGIGLNFIHLDPIRALIYAAVANGLVAPLVLVLIVQISSNKDIMGSKVNHPAISAVGWFTTILMAASGIAAIASLFF